MSYRVLIQPTAFQEIEASYRWMCDNLSAEAANHWYYELQDAITKTVKSSLICRVRKDFHASTHLFVR